MRSKFFEVPELLGKILSTWSKLGEPLEFMEIHRRFMEKGIVKNKNSRMITSRILKMLIAHGYVEKKDDKYYLVKDEPKLRTLALLSELIRDHEPEIIEKENKTIIIIKRK